jgi:hypothetical protein
MFHKTGQILPGAGHSQHYADIVAEALREELGQGRRAIKTLARWTGASERAVKNWLSGANGPNGDHLVALARRSDIVLSALLGLAGRHELMIGARLIEIRSGLHAALEQVERLMIVASPSANH